MKTDAKKNIELLTHIQSNTLELKEFIKQYVPENSYGFVMLDAIVNKQVELMGQLQKNNNETNT